MKLALFGAVAACFGLAAWLAHSISGMPLVGYDDANIFFVYARNLVDGHGFVYNVGGERVEGFTSLSWVLICAAARALTSRYEIVLFVISGLVTSVALWRMCALLEDLLAHFEVVTRARAMWLALALTIAVACAPGYVIWTVVSLMDSGLWASLLLLAAVATVRLAMGEALSHGGRLLPILMVALVLTRPESLLWGPVFLVLWAGISLADGNSVVTSMKKYAGAAIAFAVTVAGLFAWRLSYFGYPFPNTYYAKAGDALDLRFESGMMYLWDFSGENPAFLVALVAGITGTAAVVARYMKTREPLTFRLLLAQAALLVMLLVGAAIPVIEGGDHFGFWRMFQPVVPLLAIQAVLSAALLAVIRPAERHVAAAACVLMICFALLPWRHWPALGEVSYQSSGILGHGWNTARLEIAIADDMRGIGRAFNRVFPERPPSVGVIVAGGFALEYTGETIDLMGLNNIAMAHSTGLRRGVRNHMAFDPQVFYALSPDVLLLSMWSPQRPDWFKFPMLSGEFETPPYDTPRYFDRRGLSLNNFDAGVLKGLLHMEKTGQLYRWASVRPAGGQTTWIHAIFKRTFLDELTARGYEIALPGPQK